MYVRVINFFRPLKVCLIVWMMVMVENRLRCPQQRHSQMQACSYPARPQQSCYGVSHMLSS